MMLNYTPIVACVAGLWITFGTFMWLALKTDRFGVDPDQVALGMRNIPNKRYMILTNRGGYGAYDSILAGFENQEGGIKDLEFDY